MNNKNIFVVFMLALLGAQSFAMVEPEQAQEAQGLSDVKLLKLEGPCGSVAINPNNPLEAIEIMKAKGSEIFRVPEGVIELLDGDKKFQDTGIDAAEQFIASLLEKEDPKVTLVALQPESVINKMFSTGKAIETIFDHSTGTRIFRKQFISPNLTITFRAPEDFGDKCAFDCLVSCESLSIENQYSRYMIDLTLSEYTQEQRQNILTILLDAGQRADYLVYDGLIGHQDAQADTKNFPNGFVAWKWVSENHKGIELFKRMGETRVIILSLQVEIGLPVSNIFFKVFSPEVEKIIKIISEGVAE